MADHPKSTLPFAEIGMISTEHGISMFDHQPFVKITIERSDGVPLIGQLSPDDARSLATSIIESADRANYEGDFVRAALSHGIEEQAIAMIIAMVREGEEDRLGGGPVDLGGSAVGS